MKRIWTKAQEAAMEQYPCAVLVSAAAGSGKTSVLTERIIRSLTDEKKPQELNRLLVVTFTRAAAAELKSRIAKALSSAQADSAHPDQLTKQLLALGSAQISTIDSFFQKEVKENCTLLGLPASFRIVDETETIPFKSEILNRLLDDYYRKNAPKGSSGLNRLVNNSFAEAMEPLMENRSNGKTEEFLLRVPHLFSGNPDGVESLKLSAEQLERFADKDYFESPYGEVLQERLIAVFVEAKDSLRSCEDSLKEESEMFLRLSGTLSNDLDLCERALAVLKSKNYSLAKDVLATLDFMRFPTVKHKTENAFFYQSVRDKFRKDVKKMTEWFAFSNEEISHQMTETASFLRMIYAFYKDFEKNVLEEKIKRGILEFDDVRSLFHSLLKDQNGNPTSFADDLGSRFDAVYIDEYQDVDRMQDEIFALIGQNRRFMVGDIKQSIYRFRGSEPSIFAGYRQSFSHEKETIRKSDSGLCLFMSENFRCDRPIIETANRICSFLFSACENSIGYTCDDDLICSKENGDSRIPAEIIIVEKGEKSSDSAEEEETDFPEAALVAAKISELLQNGVKDDGTPIVPSDIAVLVRTNAQIPKMECAIKALNIPVTASAPNLANDPLLHDVLNLLTIVDNPYRDVPLTEFLLSPFAGFTLAEIAEIRESEPDSKALFDAMNAFRECKTNPSLVQKAAALLDQIEHLESLAAVLPADRLLRAIYAEPNLRPFDREPILTWIFDQAKTAQQSAFCGLSEFLKRLNTRIDAGKIDAEGLLTPENAVSILTVHRSKGLEYPVVFVTCCGSPFRRNESNHPVVYHAKLGYAVKKYCAEKGVTTDTALRQAVQMLSIEEETEESIRTLYVALTRARERLFITGTASCKTESLLETAALLRPKHRQNILAVNSFLPWILAPIVSEENAGEYCKLQFISPDDLPCGIPYRQKNVLQQESKVASSASLADEFAQILKNEKTFLYSLFDFSEFPGKVAASKLRPDLLDLLTDSDEEIGLKKQIELMSSKEESFDNLLSGASLPSPAEIGTATHKFMEFCDFASFAKNGLEMELTRLREEKFISEQEEKILNKHQLSAFATSNLMELLLQSVKIHRELEFGFFIPMKRLTKNATLAAALEDRQIFVQGSLDLLLELPDGTLILVDYKTDRLEEKMNDDQAITDFLFKRHGEQLEVYCEAVKRLFGKAPDRVCIYSLPAGKGYYR